MTFKDTTCLSIMIVPSSVKKRNLLNSNKMSIFFSPSSSWEPASISLNNRKCFLHENPVIFRQWYTDAELRWFCLKRNTTRKRKTQDAEESFARRKFASFLGFFSLVFTQLLMFLKTNCCWLGARSLTLPLGAHPLGLALSKHRLPARTRGQRGAQVVPGLSSWQCLWGRRLGASKETLHFLSGAQVVLALKPTERQQSWQSFTSVPQASNRG